MAGARRRPRPLRIAYRTRADALPARLPVVELARACVGACALAGAGVDRRAHRAAGSRGNRRRRRPRHPRSPVSGTSSTGAPRSTSRPLSRFWRTADGWLRTLRELSAPPRARLRTALGVGDDATVDEVWRRCSPGGRRTRSRETVHAAGGLAVALRTPAQWAAHPQGAAVAQRPLLTRESVGDGDPRARWRGRCGS
ncbi:hypothetical protein [Streptomyces sp. KL116D]|uniref:hypothetical protein n=1 Tax=Streptomyces sp. KL116D TaxID=3045152 RepID=UPI003558C1CD